MTAASKEVQPATVSDDSKPAPFIVYMPPKDPIEAIAELRSLEERDEAAMIADLQGRAIDKLFHELNLRGQLQVTLSWPGVKYFTLRQGHISVEQVQLSETPEKFRAIAWAYDKQRDVRVMGAAEQSKTMTLKDGKQIPDEFALPKVVSKDRAPTPEELQRLLDVGDLREKVIVTLTALGGFREGTLSILTYGHVKKDLEQGIIPVHVHVAMDETKGAYSDFDTFLGPEAVNYLKLCLEERRQGAARRSDGEYLPPEEITESSPLIRDANSKVPRGIGPKQIYKQIHDLFHKAGLEKKNKNGGYELRVHSLRKYFKTQLIALGVPESHADFMMGHVTDTYNQVQSLGVEKLREIYKTADLRIRTDSKSGKVDLMKQMLRSLGATPEEMAEAFRSFSEPHKVYTDPEERAQEEMQGFMTVFVNKLGDRLKNQQPSVLKSPGP